MTTNGPAVAQTMRALVLEEFGAPLELRSVSRPVPVSAHLYRIFPKLDVTSRAALRDALSRHAAQRAVQRVQGDGNARADAE